MPEDVETFISNFGSYPGENEELYNGEPTSNFRPNPALLDETIQSLMVITDQPFTQ